MDDRIDAATLPTFSMGNGKAAGEKVPVTVSHQPVIERTTVSLDELFEQLSVLQQSPGT